jgi:hypothetical protein
MVLEKTYSRRNACVLECASPLALSLKQFLVFTPCVISASGFPTSAFQRLCVSVAKIKIRVQSVFHPWLKPDACGRLRSAVVAYGHTSGARRGLAGSPALWDEGGSILHFYFSF